MRWVVVSELADIGEVGGNDGEHYSGKADKDGVKDEEQEHLEERFEMALPIVAHEGEMEVDGDEANRCTGNASGIPVEKVLAQQAGSVGDA